MAWYRDVLSLRQEGGNWFGFPDYSSIELFPSGIASVTPKAATQQSIVAGIQVADISAASATLAGRGVLLLGPVTPDGPDARVEFADLEGNRFELIQRGAAAGDTEALGLTSMGVYVQQLATMVTWYDETLGLDLVSSGATSARFVTAGGTLDLIAGGTASNGAKPTAAQPILVGVRVTNLRGAMAELKLRGVDIDDDVGSWTSDGTWPGERWTALRDPEGNRIQLKELIR